MSVHPHMLDRAGLRVAAPLVTLAEERILPGTGVEPEQFWSGLARLVGEFGPRNRALLAERERLQSEIDAWHVADRAAGGSGRPDPVAYETLLRDIGYLVDDVEPFTVSVDPATIDPEIRTIAGPQLVVPSTNARYAINAANARWGSLYDALYGTDVLFDEPAGPGYDPVRGAAVIAWVRAFLDDVIALADGSHADAVAYRVSADGDLAVALADGTVTRPVTPVEVVGFAGDRGAPSRLLLRHHGLGIELVVDPKHQVGATDAAAVADVMLESAITTIIDLEDSVATVDAEDKAHAYSNWLGLMRGDLETSISKGDRSFVRTMQPDRTLTAPDGSSVTVPGRSLMLVRNVGLLMETDAVLDADARPVPEGLVDALFSVACALHDLRGGGPMRNARAGSVYVVKPKLHGPDEAAFAAETFTLVEDVLGLPRNTVKLGLMDEERRTSANLRACIAAISERVAFINTGFLDRTGDEIHTSMEAGVMVRKQEMRSQPWIEAYEDRNVDTGLELGLIGRAQIGKGMWAAPARMRAMLEEKIGHPRAGASCAWVPSPTAATLHATHYHRVSVAERQRELADRPPRGLGDLLTLPLADRATWPDEERLAELENNAQGILGYVVRWVDQGVGCSTVPDINDVGLMEDRATCRISSQHIANWLHHGVTDVDEVGAVFRRMAAVVDLQNADDPLYRPMAPDFDGPAFRAAFALAAEGRVQPAGYTEPILHALRAERKAAG